MQGFAPQLRGYPFREALLQVLDPMPPSSMAPCRVPPVNHLLTGTQSSEGCYQAGSPWRSQRVNLPSHSENFCGSASQLGANCPPTQRTFGNVQKLLQLVPTCATSSSWLEAEDAARHPTSTRTAPQQSIIQPKCLWCQGRETLV